MIEQSNEIRKAQSLEKMDRIRHGEPLENIVMPELRFTPPPVDPYQAYNLPPADEKSLTEELKSRKAPDGIATAHMRTLNPLSAPMSQAQSQADDSAQAQSNDNQTSQNDDQDLPAEPAPTPMSPAILEYAGNNDLNIATIARQAKKDTEGNADEVVVSLR